MKSNPPRWLILAIIIALIAFVAFAARLALSTFRQRVEPARQVWTPAPARGPTLTRAPEARITPGRETPRLPSPTPEAASTLLITTPTPAPPSATPGEVGGETPPLPSPTPCAIPLALELADLHNPAVSGCPTGDTAVVWAAWEPFERGALLWRSDTDTAYAFLADGRWSAIAERWDGQPPASRGEPPAGLLAPERGFGWVWGRDDALFADLGWATDVEKGFCAQVQPFETGFLLRSSAVPYCTPDQLFNHAATAEWEPVSLVVYNDAWRPVRPALALGAGVRARPEAQGLFPARRAAGVVLDGSLDEWPAEWLPLTAVTEGAASWTGPDDLSGKFQVAWGAQGLYLAVRVFDDIYQTGRSGTDLWQGDSMEINFDRGLADDFADPTSNADDFQVGISYSPLLDVIQGYRWLPFDRESPLEPIGAVVTTPTGYDVEALIPWSAFDMTPADLAPGLTFGFNLALNDNDSNEPAQQTVVSASPARLTYDNPTQWGTLVLQ